MLCVVIINLKKKSNIIARIPLKRKLKKVSKFARPYNKQVLKE